MPRAFDQGGPAEFTQPSPASAILVGVVALLALGAFEAFGSQINKTVFEQGGDSPRYRCNQTVAALG